MHPSPYKRPRFPSSQSHAAALRFHLPPLFYPPPACPSPPAIISPAPARKALACPTRRPINPLRQSSPFTCVPLGPAAPFQNLVLLRLFSSPSRAHLCASPPPLAQGARQILFSLSHRSSLSSPWPHHPLAALSQRALRLPFRRPVTADRKAELPVLQRRQAGRRPPPALPPSSKLEPEPAAANPPPSTSDSSFSSHLLVEGDSSLTHQLTSSPFLFPSHKKRIHAALAASPSRRFSLLDSAQSRFSLLKLPRQPTISLRHFSYIFSPSHSKAQQRLSLENITSRKPSVFSVQAQPCLIPSPCCLTFFGPQACA